MSGLYIHIPFCRKRCNYCDFHKDISLEKKASLIDAILVELKLQKSYLSDKNIETIYFGGGTPSILSHDEIMTILETIYEYYDIDSNAEVSFEANPDDLTKSYLQLLKNTVINRLSIGIQSFDDKILQFMNRRHSAKQAIDCVKEARQVGFENISLDLIYGIPNTDSKYLENNLQKLTELSPEHISAYHLSIEEGTPFYNMRKRKKLFEITDKESEKQYKLLVKFLQDTGYDQYEISNFCLDDKISRHNTNYWRQKEYLGIGPSAHSYDGSSSRQWNISNTEMYISSLKNKETPFEKEVLSLKDRFNDYIMVCLRTKWGIDIDYIKTSWGEDFKSYFLKFVSQHNDHFEINKNRIKIKQSSFLQTDYLIRKIFVI